MRRRLLPALFALLALSAEAAEGVDVAAAPNLPRQELTPKTLYQFLLAEIAGSRGQVGLATEAYADLARTTRDPRVVRRAAEVALFARNYDAALAAAHLWVEIEPQSTQARQMMTALLAVTSRDEELAVHLSQQLAAAGTDVGGVLMQINRMLARHPDKPTVQRLVDRVTEPYLGVAEAHFARAQAAHGVQDMTLALSEIDRALVLRPDWEQAAVVRSQLSADPAEASRFLGSFVAANPKARDARLAYARSLVANKQYAEARREFQGLLADNRDNADVVYAVAVLSLQLNDLDEADAQLKHLIELEYSDINSVRGYLGQIAEERKQWDEAVKWYGQVTAGDQYLNARMRLANVLSHAGKLDEARQALQDTAATSQRERGQLLIAEAQLLRDAGRHADAYAVLEQGLSQHPDQPDLLYETALTAEKTGHNDVLERNLRRLIELKPDHAHAYNALGYSLADRNERLDEAQQLIDKALQLAPEDPFILDSKGWVLFRRGDAAGALDVLKKAFGIRADPEIAAHLGEVLWSLGRKAEAAKTWQDAAKANPGNDVLLGTIKKFDKP
jgi:tetratricopeptide (TPR) repeat protein